MIYNKRLQSIMVGRRLGVACIVMSILAGQALAHSITHKEDSVKQETTVKGDLGGFKGDSKIFSGDVSVSMMFKANEWRSFSGGLVHFSPMARYA